MKKIIFHLSFAFFFTLGTLGFSQQTGDDVLICGKSGTFKKKFASKLCYPAKDFPTEKAAKEQLIKDLLNMVTCDDKVCPPNFDCDKVFRSLRYGRLRWHANDSLWCTGKEIHFDWRCKPCTYNEGGGDGKGRGDHDNGSGEQDLTQNENNNLMFRSSLKDDLSARVESIYPNPSTGLLDLQLYTDQDHSEIVLTVSNIAGKIVQRKEYAKVPQSLFHTQIDLSDQPNGLYMIGTIINGVLVGTKKVLIQK